MDHRERLTRAVIATVKRVAKNHALFVHAVVGIFRVHIYHRGIIMRMGLIIGGILLAAIGIAAFTGNFNFTSKEKVIEVGSLSASVDKTRTVPQWIGGVAVLVGLGLVVVGATRKN